MASDLSHRDARIRNVMAGGVEQGVLEYLSRDDSHGVNPADPAALRLRKRLVPHGARFGLRVLATKLDRPRAHRELRALQRQSPLMLNLGSGYAPKAGWTNIDLFGAPIDVSWDLSRGIPFADGTVDAIVHEHLMEHLSLQDGLALCRDSYRALRPDGILRVGVPDAGELLGSYAGTNGSGWARSAPLPMLAVQELFYEHGHCAMYDGDLLRAVISAAGFDTVEVSEYGQSRLNPVPDNPNRQEGTLYVEAVKG